MSTKKNHLFSIVIPTYNRAHIILKTLEYVFRQTYKNYEVIIVDNHSQDNIQEVLKTYIEQDRIIFIQHDKNYERAKSRNTGMKNAKGDFLSLLDSDDIIYPEYLASAASFIKKNPGCHFFHNLHNLINEKGEIIYKYHFPEIDETPSHLTRGNYLSCNGVFISKEVYGKLNYDENRELIGSEDYDYWLRVSAYYKSGRIHEYNSAIVHHKDRSINSFTLEETIKQKDYIIQKFRNDNFLNSVYRRYYGAISSSFYLYTAVLANAAGMYQKTFRLLANAIREDISVIFLKRFYVILFRAIFK